MKTIADGWSGRQAGAVTMGGPFIEAHRISMTFPGVRALDEVDFDVRAGEVHALIGENGAGKSTLIKILSGEISGYTGELTLAGAPVRFASPREAIAAGIGVIPQELLLVSTLPADANVFLGREPLTRWGLIDRQRLSAQAQALLASLGEAGLDRPPVGHLEAGRRQIVAIARALSLNARLVIMDEPTASLEPAEVGRLERLVEDLVGKGVSVIYISHRLDEVRRLADRITVLRDGRRMATVTTEEVTEHDLVRLMVGREIEHRSLPPLADDVEELLSVARLSVPDRARPSGYRLKDVSFTVRRGEIVGLAGLVGAGRTDLLLALTGALDIPREGQVRLSGQSYAPSTPADAREAGVVLLPEDRKVQGIFPDLSVQANITMSGLARVSRAGIVNRVEEANAAGRLLEQLHVRAPSPDAPMVTLSGGNQQKALLARCLFAAPSVLLLDEPTRGIDLGAKAEVYDLIGDLAAHGFGIVVCSSELLEILTLCHRVLVFREGELVAVMDRQDATEERIMSAATGTTTTSTQPTIGPTRAPGAPPPDRPPARPALRGPSRLTRFMRI
jgi:ABC-type sugar transport system ATPase subunit